MSETSKTDMIGRRSEMLATVVLTRRLNVDVHSFGERDKGIDLICTIRPDPDDKKQGFFPFGVFVRGTAKELDSEEDANKFGHSHKKIVGSETFFMPVIVLLFSMQKDEGYFSWLVRPDKHSDKLHHCAELEFAQFDARQLDKMISEIKKWYHRLESRIISEEKEYHSSRGATSS